MGTDFCLIGVDDCIDRGWIDRPLFDEKSFQSFHSSLHVREVVVRLTSMLIGVVLGRHLALLPFSVPLSIQWRPCGAKQADANNRERHT